MVNLYSAPGEEAHSSWLVRNGVLQLQLLFRAVAFRTTTHLLLVDDERTCHAASAGASRMMGLPQAAFAGRKIDDFIDEDFRPQLDELWRAFLTQGQDEGLLAIRDGDGALRRVGFTARNLAAHLHVVSLNESPASRAAAASADESIDREIMGCALFLLDADGKVATWYSGAVRMYGHTAAEIAGQPLSVLHVEAENPRVREELGRASGAGHTGAEGWYTRKDGSKFWGNAITLALHDDQGTLQGFARLVRDFSDRHAKAEAVQQAAAAGTSGPARATVAGVASGEFDHEPEMNDALLDLVGYTREDLAAGRVKWADLTPPEYASADNAAHEEALRFGASTPFEKELTRSDGLRQRVVVMTAILKACPLRWITFIQDLLPEESKESVEQPEGESRVFPEIVGESSSLKRILRQVEVVSPTDATVLILGETGTGKESIARAVHAMSPRRQQPFVSLNCAAIPTGLLESELFGYERGAFTGALSQKIGRFEQAHRGTLFLDEIGDIPLEVQPKLLRALQEHSFERLGGTKTIPIDIRLVAATNRNLSQMMEDKLFRSDLYYRLKVFPLTAPPLRDRPDDIPILVRHFTNKYAAKMGRST